MLQAQVLGRPGEDNALWVTADSGQGRKRLLLDCGAGTLTALPFAEFQAVDHLLFSHLHMDHVGGFDDFFRATFDRAGRENHVWGPPGTAQILSHRFQGYWWNFAPELRGTWLVHDVSAEEVQSFRFEAHEAFAVMHCAGTRGHQGTIIQTAEVSVQVVPLLHHGTSLGFILREPDRLTVDREALAQSKLSPGPWLTQLKHGVSGKLEIQGTVHDAAALAAKLMSREPGDSLAYFTDFLLDESELRRLSVALQNVQSLYAEAQYAPEDSELACRHHHTTVSQVARLAAAAEVKHLTLLHLSRRYRPDRWNDLLGTVRQTFPSASFPDGWIPSSTNLPQECWIAWNQSHQKLPSDGGSQFRGKDSINKMSFRGICAGAALSTLLG
ncbi:MBL fold metallo-hydrolase [Deinococcus deserti]|uniref:Putative ribonuclease Z n=1 Tax=Deinococcus deserti (strain DSM 17065 / CIP 109153 / LMG 22923 / VCD115) TaxID=546414 RepID=C1D2U8_DEIDV|nr:MBL fold metallo-hydrolase [Deinococcus deserti]ACO47737.1 putative ribonuclease Z [Deinococcus deserti VCD115]